MSLRAEAATVPYVALESVVTKDIWTGHSKSKLNFLFGEGEMFLEQRN